MSKTLKWILGILAAVVIIAVAVAAVFVLLNHAPLVGYRLGRPTAPQAQATPGAPGTQPNQPNQPFGFRSYRGYPYEGFGGRMPMMGGRGFYGYGMFPFGFGLFFLGGLLRLLIPIIIVVLVAILFYQLGKRARPAPVPATPPAPPTDSSAPTKGRKVA